MNWGHVDWVSILSIAGLLLTLIALSVAVYQLRQASIQSRALLAHEDSLSRIAESLSTRYLGPFPEYLPSVTEMIERAVGEVIIINCNAVPGYFSARDLWIDYEAAVSRSIVKGVAVKLTTGNSVQRLRRMQQQFSVSKENWPEWRKEHAEEILSFMRSRRLDVVLAELSRETFLQQLVGAQTYLTNHLFASAAEELEVDDTITIQLWVVDNKEAVFTIESTAEEGLSHGLYTSDPQFVKALSVMGAMYNTTAEN